MRELAAAVGVTPVEVAALVAAVPGGAPHPEVALGILDARVPALHAFPQLLGTLLILWPGFMEFNELLHTPAANCSGIRCFELLCLWRTQQSANINTVGPNAPAIHASSCLQMKECLMTCRS